MAATIAKYANTEGTTLMATALIVESLSENEFSNLANPVNMI